MVSVGEDVELAEALLPLLRAVSGGRVGEEECEMYETGGEKGVSMFDVLRLADEGGKGPAQVEKMLHVGMVGRLLGRGPLQC